MTTLLAAGTCCAGPPGHERRGWAIAPDRKLHVTDLGGGALSAAATFGVVSCPIPGAAHPIACDPFRLVVLLDNAEALHLDLHGRPRWRALDAFKNNMEANAMVATKGRDTAPLLLAAWGLCGGGFAVLDRERSLWRWTAQGRVPLAGASVPGNGTVLAVTVEGGVTVVLEDGSRHAWSDGRWFPLPSLLDGSTAPGLVRVRCVVGVCLGPPRGDLHEGDIVEMGEAEARRLVREGRVQFADAGAGSVA